MWSYTYTGVDHVHAPEVVRRDMGRDHLKLMFLHDIKDGRECAGLLRRADVDVGVVAAHVEHHVRRRPCLKAVGQSRDRYRGRGAVVGHHRAPVLPLFS